MRRPQRTTKSNPLRHLWILMVTRGLKHWDLGGGGSTKCMLQGLHILSMYCSFASWYPSSGNKGGRGAATSHRMNSQFTLYVYTYIYTYHLRASSSSTLILHCVFSPSPRVHAHAEGGQLDIPKWLVTMFARLIFIIPFMQPCVLIYSYRHSLDCASR